MDNFEEQMNHKLDEFLIWRKFNEKPNFLDLLKDKSPQEVEDIFWEDIKKFING